MGTREAADWGVKMGRFFPEEEQSARLFSCFKFVLSKGLLLTLFPCTLMTIFRSLGTLFPLLSNDGLDLSLK